MEEIKYTNVSNSIALLVIIYEIIGISSIFACISLYFGFFFLNLKKIKNIKIFLIISLNPIKRFNFKTCQPDFLSNSSFELNRIRVNSKWIIQFNGSKNNLDDQ
jgi:hypothetical protein